MKYQYRQRLDDAEEIERIKEILKECDTDFCPPLSARNGTHQTTWEAAGEGMRDGIGTYLADLTEQIMLLLYHEGEIIAFLSCRTPYQCEQLKMYDKVCYLTTLCIRKRWRNRGLAKEIYEKMIAWLAVRYPGYTVAFRTWSANTAQLHIAEGLGFKRISCIENDRGEGSHTLYFARKLMWNDITDVPGVSVGQVTIRDNEHRTGVTVILPCAGFVYERKPVGAVFVLNGYGKAAGTIQLEELGTLETPIALTNTLNVGKVADGILQYILEEGKKRGIEIVSVNPVVGETNDGRINKIEDRIVTADDTVRAIRTAQKGVEQGAVGAGTGTVCFGLKGGIGSSSRRLAFGGEVYTVGVLVQSNFGRLEDLVIHGTFVGAEIKGAQGNRGLPEKGSIMVVLGTDIPLTHRQLERVLKRAGAALARLGSFYGHGSGDVFLGFSNGNCLPEQEAERLIELRAFPENQMDKIFRLVVEATEEAIINSMMYAEAETGKDGSVYHSLSEFYSRGKEIER